MNEDIIELDDWRPIWTYAETECYMCGHKQMSVYVLGVTPLQCSKCLGWHHYPPISPPTKESSE